jgi:hypothetical protein
MPSGLTAIMSGKRVFEAGYNIRTFYQLGIFLDKYRI